MSIATDFMWTSTTNLDDSSLFTNDPAFGRPSGSGIYTSYSAASGKAKVARVEEGWSENPASRQRFDETYPLVLLNRLREEDWLAIIHKVNEFWGPIVEESHKLCRMDGLLSYTILSVPVHMAKQRRLEHAITAARRHICFFLDKINEDVRDRHISFALKERDDPCQGSGLFIEVKRYKTPRRKAGSPTKATAAPAEPPAATGSSASAAKSKPKPHFLKREEKWWHFSNEDILAALADQKGGDADRPPSPPPPAAQVSSPPRIKSPRATSPDAPSSKNRKKHSPSKAASVPPDSGSSGPYRRQGRARSSTTDSSDTTRLQPHHLAAPPQHPQPTFCYSPPIQAHPQLQLHGLYAVSSGHFYQPPLQQPQPITFAHPQPPLQQLQAPVDPWALSMAPPSQRLRSRSTETRPAQRDLITW